MTKLENGKLILSKEEIELLKGVNDLELVPNQKGIFLLIDKKLAKEASHIACSIEEKQKENTEIKNEKENKVEERNEKQEEVIGLIKKAKLSDLVEGRFEKQLLEKQKQALLELVASGKVFVFKLNSSYKKGIYRVKEDEKVKRESEKFSNEKKPLPDYNLEKDGFIATSNTERARILSQEYRERIEKNELRGIKTFEGTYYLVENHLLEKHIESLLKIMQIEKQISLEELAKKENISTELCKILCEFLKEDGEIMEKKKGNYTFIS